MNREKGGKALKQKNEINKGHQGDGRERGLYIKKGRRNDDLNNTKKWAIQLAVVYLIKSEPNFQRHY